MLGIQTATDCGLCTGCQTTQTFVIKIGEAESIDFSAICRDITELLGHGHEVFLVHGGSADANILGEAISYPPHFVSSPSGYSSGYTDRKTLEIDAMTVKSKINTLLVEQFQKMGVNAFGVSGLDGRIIQARRKTSVQFGNNGKQNILHDDNTGEIERVNTGLLCLLLASRNLPVIAPIAVSENGEALNVDADQVAAMLAVALKADTLLLLTGEPGLLRYSPDENSLVHHLPKSQVDSALVYAQGNMKKKVHVAQETLLGGVNQVIIADRRVRKPISRALAGSGTIIN